MCPPWQAFLSHSLTTLGKKTQVRSKPVFCVALKRTRWLIPAWGYYECASHAIQIEPRLVQHKMVTQLFSNAI